MTKVRNLRCLLFFTVILSLLAACTSATPNQALTATPLAISTLGQTPTLALTSTFTSTPAPTATMMPTPFTGLVPPDANLRLSKGPLRFVDLSPDGKVLLVGSHIMLCTYQVSNGKENWCQTTGSRDEGLLSPLRGLSFSPNGNTFITGLEDGSLVLWDSALGQQLWTIPGAKLNTVAWSPDGSKFVVSTQDLFLRIFESQNGNLLNKIQLRGIPPIALSWSPDGKEIAGGDASGQVTLWDAGSGQTLSAQAITAAGYFVSSLGWSKDSSQILIGSSFTSCNGSCTPTNGGELVVLDIPSGNIRWHEDVNDQIHAISLSPDGKTALARVGNENLNLYQISDGKLIQSISVSGGIGAFWLPDGKSLITLDGEYELLSVDLSGNKQIIAGLKGYYDLAELVWSPDSSTLAASPINGPVTLWDRVSGKLLKTFGVGASDGPLAWSPDGKLIATIQGKNIIIWDLQAGSQAKVLTNPGKISNNMAWSPDGKLFASLSSGDPKGGWISMITLWDTSTWNVYRKLPSYQDYNPQTFITWAPDGKSLAAGRRNLPMGCE